MILIIIKKKRKKSRWRKQKAPRHGLEDKGRGINDVSRLPSTSPWLQLSRAYSALTERHGLDTKGLFHFCFLEFVNNWLSRCQLLCFLQTEFSSPAHSTGTQEIKPRWVLGTCPLPLPCKAGLGGLESGGGKQQDKGGGEQEISISELSSPPATPGTKT